MNIVFPTLELALLAAACVVDLRTRRIPNVLSSGCVMLAVVQGVVSAGWGAVASTCAWGAAAALVPAAVHLMRPEGFGGGDVKLCFAIGAICQATGSMAVAFGCGLGLAWCLVRVAIAGAEAASEGIALAPFLVAGAIAASLAG